MGAQTLIVVGLQAAIFILVFALGLNSRPEDATFLLRRPGQFIRSLLSMYVVMPVFAVMLVMTFDFPPPVQIALVALAVSPVPPLLPTKANKSGSGGSYTIGLLATMALLSIVFVPLSMVALGRVFQLPLAVGPVAVAKLALVSVLFPLAAGILVRRLAPAFAARSVKPLSVLSTVLLVVGAVPILFVVGRGTISLIGYGTLVSFAVFIAVGLISGQLLGGPNPRDRTVLALSSAWRHPGIALTIAVGNFPNEDMIFGAILLYLLLSAILTTSYVVWRKRLYGRDGRVEA